MATLRTINDRIEVSFCLFIRLINELAAFAGNQAACGNAATEHQLAKPSKRTAVFTIGRLASQSTGSVCKARTYSGDTAKCHDAVTFTGIAEYVDAFFDIFSPKFHRLLKPAQVATLLSNLLRKAP
jgi:hypothetical protein